MLILLSLVHQITLQWSFRKQDRDWKEIFNEYFGNCQSPKWTISIVRNRKEEPKNKKQWKHFFMFRDDALFECEVV